MAAAVIGLAIAGYSAYSQHEAGQKQASGMARMANAAAEQALAAQRNAEAQRDQAVLEQKRADISNLRTVRTQLRQSRIAKATILNSGANAGTSGSSGVMGGVGSVQSQSNANLGYFNEVGGINEGVLATQMRQADAAVDMGRAQGAIGVAQGQVGQAQGEAAQWGAIGGLGMSVFGGAGGFGTIFSATQAA